MLFRIKTPQKLGIAFSILAIIIFFSSIWAEETQAPTPKPQNTINLTVKTEPPGCLIFIDNALKGQSPMLTAVEIGKRRIRVTKGPEWEPYLGERLFVHDDIIQVKLILKDCLPYELGRKAFYSEDVAKATELLNKALSRDNPIPEAHFFLAILYRRTKNDEKMLQHLKKYIEMNPKESEFVNTYSEIYPQPLNYAVVCSHYLLGEYYGGKREWKKAAEEFKLSIPGVESLNPRKMEPTRKNIAEIEKRVRENPEDFDGFIQLSYLYHEKKMDYYEMRAYSSAAGALYNRSGRFLILLGNLGVIDS